MEKYTLSIKWLLFLITKSKSRNRITRYETSRSPLRLVWNQNRHGENQGKVLNDKHIEDQLEQIRQQGQSERIEYSVDTNTSQGMARADAKISKIFLNKIK